MAPDRRPARSDQQSRASASRVGGAGRARGERLAERLARAGDRFFDRLRHPGAFTVGEDRARSGGFDALDGHAYVLLVTHRRDGTPVPSPVWFARDGDVVYVKTAAHAGKVRRLQRDGRALLAPCDRRGRPRGAAVRATGRVLRVAEWDRAEAALADAYGWGRKVAERLASRTTVPAYLELRPRADR